MPPSKPLAMIFFISWPLNLSIFRTNTVKVPANIAPVASIVELSPNLLPIIIIDINTIIGKNALIEDGSRLRSCISYFEGSTPSG